MPSNQAEAITAAITEVLNDSLENISHSFVSKGEMQKVSFYVLFCYMFSIELMRLWLLMKRACITSIILLSFLLFAI